MIHLVFNNSYQNSSVGFQSSGYWAGSKELKSGDQNAYKLTETKNLLTNSGCVCALGKTQSGTAEYFVFRGLNVCDHEGRGWYVNLGIEADEDSSEQFCNVITNILLDFNAFKNDLKNWFIAAPNSSFSYDLDYERIDEYIFGAKRLSADELEFYSGVDPNIMKFKRMISAVRKNTSDVILMLVPETTLNYFNTQNPFFEGVKKQYIFKANVFKGLLEHDSDAFEVRRNENSTGERTAETNARRSYQDHDVISEFIEENKHTIKLACKITIGALAAVGAGVLIKKTFFRRY